MKAFIIIMFMMAGSESSAQTCSALLAANQEINLESVLKEIGTELRPVLDSPVIFGSVIGSPPNRKSIQSNNYSHFGELANQRPFFEQKMNEVLSEGFQGQEFNDLRFDQQKNAVLKFLTTIAEGEGPGFFEREFFSLYLEHWATNYMNRGIIRSLVPLIDARKTTLKDPEKLFILFGDFFMQYFKKTKEYWDITSDTLDSIWSNRGHLKISTESTLQRDLSALGTLNPLTTGSSESYKNFLKTSAIVIFQTISLSKRALQLESRLYNLTEIKDVDVDFAHQYARIMNDFSKLLLDTEFLLLNRERLYQDIIGSFQDEEEKLQPGIFTFGNSRLQRLAKRREHLSQSQSVFFDLFLQYELQSTAAILQDFARINTMSNQINVDSLSNGLPNTQHSVVVLDMLDRMGLQRSIILGALERFRNDSM